MITSLQRYFAGVTIVAAYNAVLVGIGALVLGVPLAGTIAVVTFVCAYIPYVGAFVAGAFAVLITLGTEGTTDALIMLVIVILANGALQQVVQPIAYGATLGLNPLVVLIVTISAGALFGMVGLVLAAPLTSAAVHIRADLAREREAVARMSQEMPRTSEGEGPPPGARLRPRRRFTTVGVPGPEELSARSRGRARTCCRPDPGTPPTSDPRAPVRASS